MKLFQSFIKKLLVIIIGVFVMCLNACSYDGVSHEFILYLPDQPEDAPLVLMLHGYGESAETFLA